MTVCMLASLAKEARATVAHLLGRAALLSASESGPSLVSIYSTLSKLKNLS